MPNADTNPTAAQYFQRINSQKASARSKMRDDIYNEVDRDLRKQFYWRGKKSFAGIGRKPIKTWHPEEGE